MRRFLIVDDNSMIRGVLQTLFDHCNLECDAAVNGKHAIEKWEQEDFQAILMDLDMPEMDGICACKEIRQRESKDKGHGSGHGRFCRQTIYHKGNM
jgi:CheY-like chemotaxis protein